MTEQDTKQKVYKKGRFGEIWAEWKFPEYINYQRTTSWYVFFIAICIGLLAFAIWDNNPLMAVMVVMVAFIIFMQNRRQANELDFQITEDGIVLDDKLYTYNQLKKFWIAYDPPEVKELSLDFVSNLKPPLAIPLGNQNPIRIRELLLKNLEEDPEKQDQSFSNGVRRMLKF
ncbi:hypothetical protein KKI23_03960 [Patescibacteria group bacterium]|nr:hypothetical protein [Patescibacteria group bacterium]